MKSLINLFAPVQSFHLNDLIEQCTLTAQKIQVATPIMLPLLETKIMQIADYYSSVEVLEWWINKLHQCMLRRRCELLALGML